MSRPKSECMCFDLVIGKITNMICFQCYYPDVLFLKNLVNFFENSPKYHLITGAVLIVLGVVQCTKTIAALNVTSRARPRQRV